MVLEILIVTCLCIIISLYFFKPNKEKILKPESDGNKQNEPQPKDALSLGIVLGMAVGAGIGVVTDNFFLGLALCMLIGAGIRAILKWKDSGCKA